MSFCLLPQILPGQGSMRQKPLCHLELQPCSQDLQAGSAFWGSGLPTFPLPHDLMSILPQSRAHACHLLHTGNQGNNFRIHVSNGLLMRGPRPLDRERNSSHVLIVEAYNHDLGPMRSSVRVRPRVLALVLGERGCWGSSL